jgi:hypothetical protein
LVEIYFAEHSYDAARRARDEARKLAPDPPRIAKLATKLRGG